MILPSPFILAFSVASSSLSLPSSSGTCGSLGVGFGAGGGVVVAGFL
jgi:hypothetical protein